MNPYKDLIEEIKALPKPNFEKEFDLNKQKRIHDNLILFSKKYKRKERRSVFIKRFYLGLTGGAAMFLFAFLLLPNIENSEPKTGSKEQDPPTIEKDNIITEPEPITPVQDEKITNNNITEEQVLQWAKEFPSEHDFRNKLISEGFTEPVGGVKQAPLAGNGTIVVYGDIEWYEYDGKYLICYYQNGELFLGPNLYPRFESIETWNEELEEKLGRYPDEYKGYWTKEGN
jgi:hypothetical protein